MRHPIRSAVVVGASALLLASGAGTAAAQGSLEFALPFPLDIPGLSSLAADAGLVPADPAAGPATGPDGSPDLTPEAFKAMAFEGSVVAAVNEARLVVGADRLITDPALEASARERAAKLAEGDPTTGELTVPEDAATDGTEPADEANDAEGATGAGATDSDDRTVLTLPEGATPQKALTALLSDTGMRERMLEGEFTRVGVGVVTAEDGTVHVVQDFARG